MMDVREKLVELLDEAEEWANHKCDELDCETCQARKMKGNCFQQLMVGRLIDNGVTVQKSSCPYCCDNGEGHGMMKHSYDDEDGMEMSIHPSTRKESGYQSQAWWATVHFRGECRDFYIEVCPFCGRRLVPLKEEMETAMPQPPKGE